MQSIVGWWASNTTMSRRHDEIRPISNRSATVSSVTMRLDPPCAQLEVTVAFLRLVSSPTRERPCGHAWGEWALVDELPRDCGTNAGTRALSVSQFGRVHPRGTVEGRPRARRAREDPTRSPNGHGWLAGGIRGTPPPRGISNLDGA